MRSETIRVVVVDDEKWARRRLEQLLRQRPNVEVVATAATGESAVRAVEEEAPDLLFLDVQIPEMDGFDVLRHLRASTTPTPAIVFVTAFDTYAVRAFDAHALDYLLKPYSDERFDEAMHRATHHLDNERLAAHEARVGEAVGSQAPPPLANRLIVKEGTHYGVIDPGEIVWVEAQDVYVCLHTTDGDRLIREPLYQVHERLGSDPFIRTHRSAVVNGSRIARLVPGSQGRATLHLDDGTEVPVSRTYRPAINELVKRLSTS
ncbi:MAG: LytTR family DNA-binding domain-containing protein [Bacteroidota bacterium]